MNLSIWRNSTFLKSVGTLLTGTAIAQVIGLLLYPIITRIYTTAEFGEFAYFNRWIYLLAAFATLRFEIALPLPKKDKEAYFLYFLSKKIALFFVLALFVISLFILSFIPFTSQNCCYVLLLIACVYTFSQLNLGVSLCVRLAKYKLISFQQICSSSINNLSKILFGLLSFGTGGLLLATLLGTFTGTLFYRKGFSLLRTKYKAVQSKAKIIAVARKYRQFPLVNLPHVGWEYGVEVIVAILIVSLYGTDVFGSYSHAFLMLKIPIGLIGLSMGQVFQNRCIQLLNERKTIFPMVKKTFFTLLFITILPFGILFFYGDSLFAFAFGSKWRYSGELAEIMIPYLAFNFMLSPLSSLPQILGKQKQAFLLSLLFGLWQLIIFGGNSSFLHWWNFDFKTILIYHTVGMTFLTGIVFCLYLHYARNGKQYF